MRKKQIPNLSGPKVKKGDVVNITTAEGIVIVGEVVSFVKGAKNWIKEVKVKSEDGFTIMEVKDLLAELVKIIGDVIKTTFFQKIKKFFTNLFRKKKNKK